MGKRRRASPRSSELDLGQLASAAESARWAMLANMVGCGAVALLWPVADVFADAAQLQRVAELASLLQLLLFVVGAAAFVPWLRAALAWGVELADSEELRRHRSRGVFWTFAVPVMNLTVALEARASSGRTG